MSTSGTYSFAPSLGEITLYAFNLCGIRSTALLQEHMESARMGANLVLADFSNKGVNLWQVALVSTPLIANQSTYNVDANVVVILDAYVATTSGASTIDRLILPISRTEYASYPNKQQAGYPTTYWHDRTLSPTVTLWPIPDGTQTSFNYYVLRQIQDSNFSNGQNVDIPYLWLKAFAYALACELAAVWSPEKLVYLAPIADKAYATAAATNVETAQQYISPMVSSYFRP